MEEENRRQLHIPWSLLSQRTSVKGDCDRKIKEAKRTGLLKQHFAHLKAWSTFWST
jgi:hypothetical protein